MWNDKDGEILRELVKNREIWRKSSPWYFNSQMEMTGERDFSKRNYAGFVVYLFLLNKLFEKAKEDRAVIVGIVEDVSQATELIKIVFPSLFFTNKQFYQFLPNKIEEILRSNFKLEFPKKNSNIPIWEINRQIYKTSYNICKKLGISDTIIFTNLLSEAQYLFPIPIFRYQTRKFFKDKFGYSEYGIDNAYKPFIDKFFPYPDYKVLATYLRTTPYREPIRVEFFDAYSDNDKEAIIGLTYYLSLFYHQYGLPIILKYVDKLARTPKTLVERIVRFEVENALLNQNFSFEPEQLLRLFKNLSRDFFRR